jgi:tRNA dimethylallyltransferase
MNKQRIVFLVGPTATGKSAVAGFLAKKINAEIVSCDSMQMYRGMDIVTAMPGSGLRKKVSHHLFRALDPRKEYDVSRYRRDALAAIARITKAGKTPLFVGGTGLYMSVLIEGLFPHAGKNLLLRKKLAALADRKGSAYLHGMLKKIDPAAARKIHPHDAKRIIRALEVYRVTGKRISDLQKERKGLGSEYDIRAFCLTMDREELYQRINRRIDCMFRQKVVNEVKKIISIKPRKTASCAIGVGEIKGYLEGNYDLAHARELMKLNTRRYAKRQLTWFRKDKRIQWISVKKNDTPIKVASLLWKKLS